MGDPAAGLLDRGDGGMGGSDLYGWLLEDDDTMEGVFVGDAGIAAVLHRWVPTAAYVLGGYPILELCGLAAGGVCELDRFGTVVRDAAAVGAVGRTADVGVYRPDRGVHHRDDADVDDAYPGEVYL